MKPVNKSPARPTGRAKKAYVATMFTGLSGNYDLVNSLCSLFVDHYWRFRAVQTLGNAAQGRVLDFCAGTLPLSFAMLKRSKGTSVALDISEGMLRTGIERINGDSVGERLYPVGGDGEALPFMDGSFDGAMAAFGVRNLSDLDDGLRELSRVTRTGGILVILEFSIPKNRFFNALYRQYLKRVMVPVSGWLTGDKPAYEYLIESIEAFFSPEQVCDRLQKSGFRRVETFSLTGGIVTLYRAERR